MKQLAGEPVRATLTAAPGNGQPFGGIKVTIGPWLVRRAAFGHRRRLQDLRRKLSQRGAPEAIQHEAQAAIARAFGG